MTEDEDIFPILELRPSRKRILAHLGERIEPSSASPARGPPNNWGEFTQVQDERDAIQVPPDELPAIDIHGVKMAGGHAPITGWF